MPPGEDELMTRQPDYVRKKYGPLLSKTLQNAVSHCLHKQFPRIGGPRIRALCATMILEVLARHVRPRDHVRHGQVLWMAVSVDDPPRIRQPFERAELVPVVLDLSTPEDIEARIDRRHAAERAASPRAGPVAAAGIRGWASPCASGRWPSCRRSSTTALLSTAISSVGTSVRSPPSAARSSHCSPKGSGCAGR